MTTTNTNEPTTEELEKQLADARAERAKGKEAQYRIDLKARIALEEEYGTLAGVEMTRFVPGQPTRAYLRAPDAGEYKRYKAQVYAAAQKKGTAAMVAAQELLAKACWIYPATADERDAMLEAFPGLLSPLASAAAALAEGKAEEEGKD